MKIRPLSIGLREVGLAVLVATCAGAAFLPTGPAFAQSAGGVGGASSAGSVGSGGLGGASGGASAIGGASVTSGTSRVGVQTSASPVEPSVTSGARSLSGGGTQNAGEAGLAQENSWDLGANSAGGRQGGDTSASTQAEATAGQTNVNSVSASAIATSGNPNTLSGTGAASIGGAGSASRGRTSIAGAGRPEDYRIPKPVIGVDLVSIRSALRSNPGATPNRHGD